MTKEQRDELKQFVEIDYRDDFTSIGIEKRGDEYVGTCTVASTCPILGKLEAIPGLTVRVLPPKST